MRWWLVRGPDGRWKVYDHDLPSIRLRASVRLAGYWWEAAVGAAGPGGPPAGPGLPPRGGFPGTPPPAGEPRGPVDAVTRAVRHAEWSDLSELMAALDDCRGAELPPPLAAGRAVAEAFLRVRQGRPGEATPFLDKAAKLDPDFPSTHLVRGIVANRTGDHETALKHLTAYQTAVGPEAEVALEIGVAREGLRQPVEALTTYRAAVKDFPGHTALYPALVRALPAGGKREAGELAAKGPKPAEHLTAILSDPVADDVAVADAVLGGFLAGRPDDPTGLAYAAAVRVKQGKGTGSAGWSGSAGSGRPARRWPARTWWRM